MRYIYFCSSWDIYIYIFSSWSVNVFMPLPSCFYCYSFAIYLKGSMISPALFLLLISSAVGCLLFHMKTNGFLQLNEKCYWYYCFECGSCYVEYGHGVLPVSIHRMSFYFFVSSSTYHCFFIIFMVENFNIAYEIYFWKSFSAFENGITIGILV